MDFHEIEMKGDFKTDNIKSKNGVFVFDIDDSTGKITLKTNLKIESGTPINDYILVSDADGNCSFSSRSIPAGSIIIFESDVAMNGYTLLNSVDDKVIYSTKGSAAGGNAGGILSGTWTIGFNHRHTITSQSGHSHSYSSHIITNNEMPSHYHLLYSNSETTDIYLEYSPNVHIQINTYPDDFSYVFASTNNTPNAGKTSYTGGGSSHTHSVNSGGSHSHGSNTGDYSFGSSWRPYGMNYTMQQKS